MKEALFRVVLAFLSGAAITFVWGADKYQDAAAETITLRIALLSLVDAVQDPPADEYEWAQRVGPALERAREVLGQ